MNRAREIEVNKASMLCRLSGELPVSPLRPSPLRPPGPMDPIAMMTVGSSWGKRGSFRAWKRPREPGRISSAILVSWGRTGQESPEVSSVVRFGQFSRGTFSTKSPTV